jgi:hypothetical protein
MRRGEMPLQRTHKRMIKLSNMEESTEPIPEGFSRASVLVALSHEELCSLRHNAEFQAASYQTLPGQTVEDLTKELNLLEDHCDTLHRTAISLREGRKALHNRLLSFLKAPANAFVARDHLIKQESALSELDNSIDEYTTKLEAVQERRTRVQRKLLEHVGAVLSLRISEMNNATNEEQTPPRSPAGAVSDDVQLDAQQKASRAQAIQDQEWEDMRNQRKRESEARRERLRQIEEIEQEQMQFEEARHARTDSPRGSLESIRVYADHGVASLLASIEQEIDAMDQMRRV